MSLRHHHHAAKKARTPKAKKPAAAKKPHRFAKSISHASPNELRSGHYRTFDESMGLH